MNQRLFSEMASSAPKGFSFTLIHGTIPKIGPFRLSSRRSWTDDDSEFTASLRRAFSDGTIEKFRWSGGNSHAARQSAGAELASHLMERKLGRRILIAHSHGGNVALYALRQCPREVVEQVAGIVFLGTPFLTARPSKVATRFDLWLAVSLGGILGAIALWLTWNGHITIPVLLSCSVLGVSLAGAWRLSRLDQQQWEKLGHEYAQVIDTSLQADIPMYAVCAMRDEALLLLNGVSLVTRAMQNLRRWLIDWFIEVAGNCREYFKAKREPRFNTQEEIEEWIRYRRYAELDQYRFEGSGESSTGYAVAVALFLVPMLLPMAAMAVLTLLLLPIVALCSAQVIVLANLLTRSAPWGFGEHWLLQWLVEVNVSKWPPNETYLTSIEDRMGILAFQHSALTSYPKFLEDILHWIDSLR